MNCTQNKKKFLWFTYNGPHKFDIIRVGKFMRYVSEDFIVWWECRRCGIMKKRSFVTYDELLHMGYTKDQIEKFEGEQI
jgi:hypothetical protein